MDSAFLSSALVKVPSGAWFTITLSAVLAALFILWRFGKEQQWRAERQDRQPLSHYVKVEEQSRLRLATNSEGKGGEALSITKGLGIFFDKGGEKCPIIFSQFISKLVSKPDVTIFFHLRPLESPTVPEDERYIVQKLDRLPNCFRVVARYGYMDEVVTPDLASLIYGRIRDYIIREHALQDRIHPGTTPTATASNASPFLFIRENTRNKMANVKVHTDRLVEIGFVMDV